MSFIYFWTPELLLLSHNCLDMYTPKYADGMVNSADPDQTALTLERENKARYLSNKGEGLLLTPHLKGWTLQIEMSLISTSLRGFL